MRVVGAAFIKRTPERNNTGSRWRQIILGTVNWQQTENKGKNLEKKVRKSEKVCRVFRRKTFQPTKLKNKGNGSKKVYVMSPNTPITPNNLVLDECKTVTHFTESHSLHSLQ